MFDRNVALELEPLELRDTIGPTLIFASLCVVSCGAFCYGGASYMYTARLVAGLALTLGGGAAFGLTVKRLQPHKPSSTLHTGSGATLKLRPHPVAPAMTDAHLDAVKDALDD